MKTEIFPLCLYIETTNSNFILQNLIQLFPGTPTLHVLIGSQTQTLLKDSDPEVPVVFSLSSKINSKERARPPAAFSHGHFGNRCISGSFMANVILHLSKWIHTVWERIFSTTTVLTDLDSLNGYTKSLNEVLSRVRPRRKTDNKS